MTWVGISDASFVDFSIPDFFAKVPGKFFDIYLTGFHAP